MSNKIPPTPLVCEVCKEDFYGRKGAKTCSARCRKRKQYIKEKEVDNARV